MKSHPRSTHMSVPFAPSWISLRRWENYALLAMASLALLAVVTVRAYGGASVATGTTGASAKSTASTAPSTTSAWKTAADASPKAMNRLSEPKWKKRHQIVKAKLSGDAPTDVLLLGDSITQGWEYSRNWTRNFPSYRTVNAGIASDRVEHVLWRVENGLIGRSRPKVVVLLAGVNNMAVSTPAQIAAGQARIIETVLGASPNTQVLIVGVFPTGKSASSPRRAKVKRMNERLAKLADGQRVHFVDIGSRFLEKDGSLSNRVMFDYLHLTPRAYDRYASALKPKLRELMAKAPQS
jgi:lysophospholipase L1-like esterase